MQDKDLFEEAAGEADKAKTQHTLDAVRNAVNKAITLSQSLDDEGLAQETRQALALGINGEMERLAQVLRYNKHTHGQARITTLGRLDEDSTGGWLLEKPTPPRALLQYGEEDAMYTRAAHALRPAIPQGDVCLLIAPGGTGKTWFLFELACVLAARENAQSPSKFKWGGCYEPTRGTPCDVLLILGETNKESVKRRLQGTVRRLLGTFNDPNGKIGEGDRARYACAIARHIHVLNLHGDPRSLDDITRQIIEDEKHEGREYGAVILDPLARFSMAENENDNKGATDTIARLEMLTKLPGNPSVFVSHHVNKAAIKEGGKLDVASVRGASGLVDGARCVIGLSPVAETSPQVVELHTIKLNDMAHSTSPPLVWDETFNAGFRRMNERERARHQQQQPEPYKATSAVKASVESSGLVTD